MGRNEEKTKYKPMDKLYRDKETGKLIQVISDWNGTGTESLDENEKLIPIPVQPSEEGDEHDIWIQRTEVGYIVTVGGKQQIHPKGEDHYIEHLELEANGRVYRIKMTPYDSPVRTFTLTYAPIVYVRALCSRHGLFEKVYVEMDIDVEADSGNLYHEWAHEKPKNEWDDSLKRIEARKQEIINQQNNKKDNS
jgi:desulfoferrodoxin (superoxide reductase-like protein)